MPAPDFTARLRAAPCIGMFSKTTDSALVEAAGYGGLDFMILDTEHGPVSLETLHHHVRAAMLTPMAALIRVRNTEEIGAALDSGTAGIVVPNINTAEQAAAAVKAARFHPHGQRGVCRFVRAAQFGLSDKMEYFVDANRHTLILQVEGVEGVRNLDAILAVGGFDVLFIGPYDLSQSLGKPGQVDAPEVIAAMREIVAKAQAKNILLGTFCDTPERLAALKKEGFAFLACGVDVNLFATAVQSLVASAKG